MSVSVLTTVAGVQNNLNELKLAYKVRARQLWQVM
jgi:hypothetical protein